MASENDIEHVAYNVLGEHPVIVILFIHGILESPNQFKEMAELAKRKGISSVAILLPGHGGTGEEFASSHQHEWRAHVECELEKLRASYHKIILVGHSMGTLLSILSYVANQEKIIGCVFIASPLRIHLRPKGITCSLKVALNQIKQEDCYTVAMANGYSIKRSNALTYLKWMPRYLDLFKLVRESRQAIEKLKIPTLIVSCGQDEFVSEKSLDVFKKNLTQTDYKLLNLTKSGHFYYDDVEKLLLHEAFDQFISQFV